MSLLALRYRFRDQQKIEVSQCLAAIDWLAGKSREDFPRAII